MSAVTLVWSTDWSVCTLTLACFGFCFPEVFVFQGYFDLSSVWLIFSFSRPPAPLETITFSLFPAIPSTVCAQSWYLMLCRYSLAWYDCRNSLLFKDNFCLGFVLQKEEWLSGRQGTPSTSSVTVTTEQCISHPYPPSNVNFQMWRRDTFRNSVYFPASNAVQILFLVLWSLNIWSWSVLVLKSSLVLLPFF